MEQGDLKTAFYRLVAPSYPNEWEVDEALDILAETGPLQRQALLDHVPAIWPISHSLCFSFLAEGIRGLASFPLELLPEWVRQILSRYEEGGLRLAREFMADVDRNFLDPLRGRAGVAFAEMAGRMLPYIRGVSGLSLELAMDGAGRAGTDTRTIFLPGRLNLFPEREDNLLLYKVLISIQWGFIAIGTYGLVPGPDDFAAVRSRYKISAQGTDIEAYFRSFPDPELAAQVFHILEFARVYAMIARELPGLVRQSRPLFLRLLQDSADLASARDGKVRDLLRSFITGGGLPGQEDGIPAADDRSDPASLRRLPETFAEIHGLAGEIADGGCMILLGQLDFAAAQAVIEQQRLEERELFIALLAAFIEERKGEERTEEGGSSQLSPEADALLLIAPKQGMPRADENSRRILINNEEMVLSDVLTRAVEDIESDLGTLPPAYILAAAGMAGKGRGAGSDLPREDARNISSEAFALDEWDYRRSGYRKAWCSLYEKELPPVVSNFVSMTLQKHRGLIVRVKRQFEMLRTTQRFVRRSRYGDDLDFDAIVEALGDQRAGFSPSDRLFIRLLRDERDIAALFLVDMSNSTEGWIGTLIKEGLVILGEVMEVVGDRYGIYGFSGMRRSRCELYHIKHLDEVYGDQVRQRIAAIGPREYTRMGPPIRHLTRLLRAADARLRLLITLTDGKPEDYDGYNDEYAIEDTRKALVEARGAGVQSFCINIDQQASGYLRHMYGEGNYVFLNKIEKLPVKMAEFYRLLTS